MWGHVVMLLARLISYVGNILQIPTGNIYAWADSSVVPSWLCRNPQRFKAFVGNCLSEVIELISPNCWQQVKGADNPADSVSRGIIPAEEIKNDLWWEGPQWLRLSESTWPEQPPPPIGQTGAIRREGWWIKLGVKCNGGETISPGQVL